MTIKFICRDTINQQKDYIKERETEIHTYMIQLLSRYTPDKDPFAVVAWKYNTLDKYGYPRGIKRSNGSNFQPHQETGKGTGWFMVDDYNNLLVSMLRSGAVRIIETSMEKQLSKVDEELSELRNTLNAIEVD